MKKRKIVYVTGSRAEYGVMRELLKKMNSDKALDLFLIVTGAHLMKEFGCTIKDIINDGLKIAAKVDMKIKSTPEGSAKSVGYAILGITDALKKIKPDLVMVTGDRGEMLAAAISASRLHIPIIHLSGGDVSGHIIDESTRHAITKLCNIHLAETKKSAERIVKMGEEPNRVFFVGNPSLGLKHFSKEHLRNIVSSYGINTDEPFALLLYHGIPGETAGKNINVILNVLAEIKMQTIAIYPNVDPGCDEIIEALELYARNYNFIQLYKNISHENFQALMQEASFMIGNSSAALFEAPSFKLPAINIGFRQERREKTINIIDVKNCTRGNILNAIKKAQSKKFRRKLQNLSNPYYLKNSKERIIRIIKSLKLNFGLLLKKTMI